ncbi:MAG TPA: cyclase family protein [Blastocatellia bacterium]|nr:cyclase family protein [Blastocatellia bacterium]
MSVPERLPAFDELPIKPDHPPHSAWGVFGDDDQIGTLNLLAPERVAAAARLAQQGKVFALNWELELPDPPLFNRTALRRTLIRRRHNVFDDAYDDFNTQSSTQWDGLRHNGHRQYGFYNGVTGEQIADEANASNGIHHWARRGIAGRGVLIDFPRFAGAQGIAFTLGERYGISARQLQEAAEWQGVSFQTGDILLLRTGWIEWYSSLNKEQRIQIARPGELQAAGLEQGEESLRFLWDNHFAAIASDNPSFEAHPSAATDDGRPGESMHGVIIGLWGMPIGELFQLDALAADCGADRRYEFFFTSAPLNKLGGVASPPNALAIK